MKKIILVISLAILYSCNNTEVDHAHDHDEANGLEALAYTLYSDKTEIFVEFKPLIVNRKATFAAHFTILGEHFKPLNEGSVTVSLIVNGKGIKHTADTPSVPGIYRLALLPKVAGKGDLIFDIKAKDFDDRQIIRDVLIYPDEQTALNDQKEDSGSGNDISYLKEQAWKVEFASAPVIKQPFSNILKTSGQLLSAPGDETIITARATGIVRYNGNTAITGSAIKKGTPMFLIIGGDLSQDNLDVAVQQAKANFEKAKSDFERSGELVKDKIISVKEFEQVKLDFENAKAEYNMLVKSYSGEGLSIQAPMEGFVKNVLVKDGQFVTAGTPLATISKNNKLILQANVSEKHYNLLPSLYSANFKTTNSTEFYNTEKMGGKIVSYGKSSSAGSPFIPVTFEMNNPGGVIPGSIAEVYLKFEELDSALVIPVTALIEEQGNFFLFIQTGGESFEKREVKLGASDGLKVQVLSGITEGERVVTKGAYQIKLSNASGTMPAHGHEH